MTSVCNEEGRDGRGWTTWILGRVLGLVAGVLLVVAAPRAHAEDDEAAPWDDPAQLEAWLAEACDAVEVATGRTFDPRPTVRLADAAAIREVLEAELAEFDPRAVGREEGQRMARLLSPALMAKYAPDQHAILFQPAAFKLVAGLQPSQEPLGVPHVRVLLAHEATHALDFQHHPLHERMKTCTNDGELRAVGAMSEGHAQFVAKEVARVKDLLPAFERLTHAILGEPEEVPDGMRPVLALMLAEVGFAYGVGHRFFDAVYAARGRDGVEAALADPPLDPSWVEEPRYWLDPSSRPAPRNLEALLATCSRLVPAPPWANQSSVMTRTQLASQAGRLPEERRALFLEGFETGQALVGQYSEEQAMLVLGVMAFDSEAMATRFAADNRALLDGAGEALASMGIEWSEANRDEALGTKRDVSGIYAERMLELPGGAKRIVVLQFRQRDLVFDIMAMQAPWLERRVFDQVVDRLVAAASDAQAAMELPLDVPAVTSSRRQIRVRVLDTAGEPVPRARWWMVIDSGRWSSRLQSGEVKDGWATLEVDAGVPARLDVVGAGDADGTALDLAPVLGFGIPAEGDAPLEVRLPAGLRIGGVLRDADGLVVSGALLSIRFPRERGSRPPMPHGHADLEAMTDAAGRFGFVGLPTGSFDIRLQRDDESIAVSGTTVDAGTHDAELRVPRLVDAVITVNDEAGLPLEGVHVSATSFRTPMDTLEQRSATTDAKGRAHLRHLEADRTWSLGAEARMQDPGTDRAPLLDRTWAPSDTTIVLERGWTLRGVVRDASGAPAPQATIRLRVTASHWRHFEADAKGRFTAGPLPPGAAELRVERGDGPEAWRILGLADGEETWARIEPTEDNVELTYSADPEHVYRCRLHVVGPGGTTEATGAIELEVRGASGPGPGPLRSWRHSSIRTLERGRVDIAVAIRPGEHLDMAWVGPPAAGTWSVRGLTSLPAEMEVRLAHPGPSPTQPDMDDDTPEPPAASEVEPREEPAGAPR